MSTAPLAGLGEPRAMAAPRRMIPFDLAFTFELAGEVGRLHRDTETISIEAPFVAVSIGYGILPRVDDVRFGPPAPPPAVRLAGGARNTLRSITLGDVIDGLATALDEVLPGGAIGGRVGNALASGFKLTGPGRLAALLGQGNAPLDAGTLASLFQVTAAPSSRDLQFRYALFDDATGREFQSEPILNIAGLGSADGDRPFRYFARPIRFAPRSTIRLEVIEESETSGKLFVSLQGYKLLGSASSPTGRAIRRAAGGTRVRRRLRRLQTRT